MKPEHTLIILTLYLAHHTLSQNYAYSQDRGHLSVDASANTSSPNVHMIPQLNNQASPSPFPSSRGSPILVNNLSGLQPSSIQPYMPSKFSFNPSKKIQIDSAPRNLKGMTVQTQNPATQSPLLNGINNMNSSKQLPLNLNMVLGKALKKKKSAERKRRRRRRRARELREQQEVRSLLGFQKNFPFSNKYFGQSFPKFVPDSMYFNPTSTDIGGVPKLDVDESSKCFFNAKNWACASGRIWRRTRT